MSTLPGIAALAGFLVGALAAWLYMKAHTRSELGVLEERVHSKDEQLRMSWGDVDALKAELQKAQTLLRQEGQMRLGVEQHAARAGILEKALQSKETQFAQLVQEFANLKAQMTEQTTRVSEMQKSAEEKTVLLNQAKEALAETFKSISSEALRASSEQFMQLAKSEMDRYKGESSGDLEGRQKAVEDLVRPLRDSLEKVDIQLKEIEEKRVNAYSSLTHQLSSMALSQERLNAETSNLSKALKSTGGKGRWGEMQLRRVVELAGMVEYCDFQEQPAVPLDDGVTRPDMLIRLPNSRVIAVDSKSPFMSFLEAVEAKDETVRTQKLQDHAAQIRGHIAKLGSRAYWEQFLRAPEFVVLFLPGDTFYSAALEQDPTLIEHGVAQNVIVATPTTLISLMRAVSYGWRQEKVDENAQKIQELGRVLYERVKGLAEHFARIGVGLETTIRAYNGAVGLFENKVLVAARRFKELGAGTEDIHEVKQVERTPLATSESANVMQLVPGPGPEEQFPSYDLSKTVPAEDSERETG